MAASRSIRGKLLLLVAGCGAALLLGELLIRVTGAAPELAFFGNDQFQLSRNERIGWEPIPNPESSGDTLHPRWHDTQRNSLGYRDYEHSVAKVPGVFRIAVIGDSVAKGFGTPEHERTFPAVLERELRESGVSAEVMSFAVEGYNTQQEVETLADRALRYSPDLVLLAYVLNDRSWPAHHLYTEMLQQEKSSARISGTRVSPLLARSALYRFLRFRVLDRFLAGAVNSDARIQRLVGMVQQDTVAQYFGVLQELRARRGFDVLVVVFPYLRSLSGARYREEHAWVAALSAKHGFRHLDLRDAFALCERESKDPIAHDIVHPTAVGLRCAGIRTARFLKQAGIVRAAGGRPLPASP
jgi:hypothetical protein